MMRTVATDWLRNAGFPAALLPLQHRQKAPPGLNRNQNVIRYELTTCCNYTGVNTNYFKCMNETLSAFGLCRSACLATAAVGRVLIAPWPSDSSYIRASKAPVIPLISFAVYIVVD